MAKQTFTTGQVLTAAQVNSLQTNDFNQTVSVKTAAYVLAAADKGTRIEFNTSGSVTCTVNTGLFDAGDTVIIQNRGAGDVTVTAGTATVNTAGSLVLSQYQSGTLYFISASASIFFAAAAGDLTAVTSGTGISISNAGGPVPTITNSMATEISAKGDLIVGTGSGTFDNLTVGANNTVLTADSTTATGLKWAAVGGGSWSAWTPAARSGFTVGNGTETARYNENNGIVFFFYKFVLGSTSSVSAQMTVQLPSTPATAYGLTFFQGNIRDDGSNNIDAVVQINGSDIQWNVFANTSTYGDRTSPSGSIPMVWTTGDFFSATGFYEKA